LYLGISVFQASQLNVVTYRQVVQCIPGSYNMSAACWQRQIYHLTWEDEIVIFNLGIQRFKDRKSDMVGSCNSRERVSGN
jgi:hypothetical protein